MKAAKFVAILHFSMRYASIICIFLTIKIREFWVENVKLYLGLIKERRNRFMRIRDKPEL